MDRDANDRANALTTQVGEFLAPTTIRSLFWRPRFVTENPLLLHTPFLFWLTSIVQPRRIAVLGANDGYAHFLFCQAIDKANIHGRVEGFGFWPSGEDDRPAQLPSLLSDHEQKFYEDASVLRTAKDNEAACEQLPEESYDIVFVDLEALPDDENPSAANWRRLLKENAILLLHGTNSHAADSRVSTGLAKLRNQAQSIEFRDGKGLSVLVSGKETPERLRNLLKTVDRREIPPEIAVIFRRLGQSLAHDVEAKALRRRVQSSNKDLLGARTELEAANDELETLREAYDLRTKKVAEIEAKLFDLQRTSEKKDALTQQTERKLHETSQEKAQALERVALLEAELDKSNRIRDKERSELKRALDEHKSLGAKALERARVLEKQFAQSNRLHLDQMAALKQNLLEEQAAGTRAIERVKLLENELADSNRIHFEETAALTSMVEEQKAAKIEALARARSLEEQGVESKRALTEEAVALSKKLDATDSIKAEAIERARAMKRQIEKDSRRHHEELAALKKLLLEEQVAGAKATGRARLLENELENSRRLRFEETAALTRMLEEQKDSQNAADTKIVEMREHLNLSDRDKERLQEYIDALLASTSWRITSPIRRLKKTLRR
ncbi:MAG: hypothetical protein Q4F71_06745 [Paracoccus sp. (in: a-proteobacteria)]|nr:hypothetical protein [Paracoccus sp. (in: a-proteobacteria)]